MLLSQLKSLNSVCMLDAFKHASIFHHLLPSCLSQSLRLAMALEVGVRRLNLGRHTDNFSDCTLLKTIGTTGL